MTGSAGAGGCPGCGTVVARALLSCPACQTLVHGTLLKELAATAHAAAGQGDLAGALVAWRRSLDLLPADSRQHAWVADQIATLSHRADDASAAGPVPSTGRWK